MRLSHFLAQAGVASRRKAEALIIEKAVKVNGVVVGTLGSNVGSKDRVEVNGRRVQASTKIYRLLLKPRACLATLVRSGARPTLARYVRDAEPGLEVAAPLDFPAEGVVLLTNDGELRQALAKGSNKKSGGVPMTYHIKFQGLVTADEIARLGRGWRADGRLVRPTAIEALAKTEKNTWVEMVVTEPRPRALKAAGELLRHTVLKVSRIRMGALSFEGLAMGGWRDLTKAEIGDLRRRAGLE